MNSHRKPQVERLSSWEVLWDPYLTVGEAGLLPPAAGVQWESTTEARKCLSSGVDPDHHTFCFLPASESSHRSAKDPQTGSKWLRTAHRSRPTQTSDTDSIVRKMTYGTGGWTGTAFVNGLDGSQFCGCPGSKTGAWSTGNPALRARLLPFPRHQLIVHEVHPYVTAKPDQWEP